MKWIEVAPDLRWWGNFMHIQPLDAMCDPGSGHIGYGAGMAGLEYRESLPLWPSLKPFTAIYPLPIPTMLIMLLRICFNANRICMSDRMWAVRLHSPQLPKIQDFRPAHLQHEFWMHPLHSFRRESGCKKAKSACSQGLLSRVMTNLFCLVGWLWQKNPLLLNIALMGQFKRRFTQIPRVSFQYVCIIPNSVQNVCYCAMHMACWTHICIVSCPQCCGQVASR